GIQHRQQSADLARTVDALRVEVTGRSRAEAALRESEQRFRLVTQLASDAIVVSDAAGPIVAWDRGAGAVFGFKGAEVMGLPIEGLVPPRCRRSYGRRFEALRASRESRVFGRTLELWGRRKSGSEFPLEVSLTSWNTREGRFFSGIIRDITERKRGVTEILRLNALLESRVRRRTADLERSNRALTEFTSVAAHALQEPLRTVATFTDLLARRFKNKLDAEADKLIAHTEDAVNWMHALIKDLLGFSRIGTETLRLGPADAQTALGRALANLK